MTLSRSKLMLAALAMGLALWVSACAGGDEASVQPGLDCTSRADCGAGEVCVEGYCSVEQSESIDLDFRFFPPQDSLFRPQQITDVAVTDSGRLNFGLEPGITVTSGTASENPGGILFSDRAGGPSGNLLFSPTNIEDSRFTTQVRVDDGQFDVLVHPGTYKLTFVPDSDALPQKIWTDLEFIAPFRFVRRIPSDASLQRVDGFVSRDVLFTEVTGEPVPGATVYATARDGDVISTASVTDAEGRFSLFVESNVGAYDIHVGPSADNAHVPDYVFEDRFEVGDNGCVGPNGENLSCQLPTLSLGAYMREPVPFDVRLEPAQRDWTGTRIQVLGELGKGRYSRTVSAQDGGARLELFPYNEYTIVTLPPAESPFARTSRSVFIEQTATELPGGPVIELEQKREVSGVLVDSNGERVAFQRIEFTPEATAAASASEDIDTRPITTETAEDGSFSVYLEGIEHDVLIRPSAGSGLPITRRSLSASVVRTGGDIELQLAQPRVLTGSVLGTSMQDEDSSGTLGGVVVRAYQRVDGEVRLVGEAQSDTSSNSRGNFRMVISSELD